MIKKHLNGEIEYCDCEIRMRHKSGQWIWVRDRGKIIEKDSYGQPLKMFGTNIDVTDSYEQALELERFFTVNLDLLCIIDAKGRFIKTNKAWEDILGYSTSQLNRTEFIGFVHEDDVDSTLEIIKNLKRDGKVVSFFNRYISLDGSYRYIEWTSNW